MDSKNIIHILGIGGTLMSSIAILAKEAGYDVTGQDEKVISPTRELLIEHGIDFKEGFSADAIDPDSDFVVVGNIIRRGMPIIEDVLNLNFSIISGPEFLGKYVLQDRKVIAVSGTHGKTSTTSMIAWILETAGLNPGFLIGGRPKNFSASARVGSSDFFVIESDEYDTAYFDKRPKFMHYSPYALLINNIEFDHADIYDNLESILRQFHYLIRLIKPKGHVIYPDYYENVLNVIERGCWSESHKFSRSEFILQQRGKHYQENASAAAAVAKALGIKDNIIKDALSTFEGVKRRQELVCSANEVRVYDDFAHHPTAIQETISSFIPEVKDGSKLVAILNISSNTMNMGTHKQEIIEALKMADVVYFVYKDSIKWSPQKYHNMLGKDGGAFPLSKQQELANEVMEISSPGDTVLIMSNSYLALVDSISLGFQAMVTG